MKISEKILEHRAKQRIKKAIKKIMKEKHIYYTFYERLADILENYDWMMIS